MNDSVIQCLGLKKTFDDGYTTIEVLRDVHLQVKKREFVAIVGSSGSGKSTLLHLLGGLDQPTGGRVIIAGKELSALREQEKCEIRNQYLGFVYQFHHLLPEFTALENVSMPLLIGHKTPRIAKEKAEHLLESVGLKNRLTHKTGELSGGERQRVAIARALVTDPLCILADEPTGNLDPANADKILELFIDLQKRHQASVIVVTHDMKIAHRADRQLRLDRGQLVELESSLT